MGGLSNLVNLANIALLLLFFGILLWEFSRAKELGALVCSWNFAFGGGNWVWSKAPVFILSHSGSAL